MHLFRRKVKQAKVQLVIFSVKQQKVDIYILHLKDHIYMLHLSRKVQHVNVNSVGIQKSVTFHHTLLKDSVCVGVGVCMWVWVCVSQSKREI